MSLADFEHTFLMDMPLALSTQISTVIPNKKPQPLEFCRGQDESLPFLSLWFFLSQALMTAPDTGCRALGFPACSCLHSAQAPCLSLGGQKPLVLGLILPTLVYWAPIIGSMD